MSRKEILEGAMAVAHAVARCRPEVVAAYPITPQTHISEELSTIVADGELDAEFVKVESEFGAASVVKFNGLPDKIPVNGFCAPSRIVPEGRVTL